MKAIITDFDGTLCDTFDANLLAYQNAFKDVHKELTKEEYIHCFGMRFAEFMDYMHIDSVTAEKIKASKAKYYKTFINRILINNELLQILKEAKEKEIQIAIASTASKVNLMHVLNYFNLTSLFDVIITGEDVKNAKPHPEIYVTALHKLGIEANDAIVYEDSVIGIAAAKAANIKVKIVNIFKK